MMNFWNSKFNTRRARLCGSEYAPTEQTTEIDHGHAI